MKDDINLPKLNENNSKMSQPTIIEESKETIIYESKSFIKFLKDAKDYITTKNTKDLWDLALQVIIIAVLILALFVPFQLVRDLGINVIISLGINFNDKILNTYNAVFNILYSVFGIVLFFILCKNRFYNLIKNQNELKELQK